MSLALTMVVGACASAPAGNWPWSPSSELDAPLSGGDPDARPPPDAFPDAQPDVQLDARPDTRKDDGGPVPDAPLPDAQPDAGGFPVTVMIEADYSGAGSGDDPDITCSGLPNCGSVAFACTSGCGLITVVGSGSAGIINGTANLMFDLTGIVSVSAATTTVVVRDINSHPTTCKVRDQSMVATTVTIPAGPSFTSVNLDWASRLAPGAANTITVARIPGTAQLLLRRIRLEFTGVAE